MLRLNQKPAFRKVELSKGFAQFPARLRAGGRWGKNWSRECFANLVALNLYPLGLLEPKQSPYPHPHFAENSLPILLVHGIVHNHSAFRRLQKKFYQLGWHNIFTMNYRTATGSIHRMAGDLALRVDHILQTTGAPQIDIVAHSLGGLVSREFLSTGTGRGKIRRLVTLGTPHQGTPLSKFLRWFPGSSLGEDLQPGSYFLKNLIQTPLPKNAEIISLASHFDWTSDDAERFVAIGTPAQAFRNIFYDDLGHTGLLFSEAVFRDIAKVLTRGKDGEEEF